jgi:carboxymethylenebutenolidase
MADLEILAADGHRLSAHLAEPTGTPRGGVVVIQEIFGVNAHIRSVADRFAEAGFVAVAPALFDRTRRGVELGYDLEGVEVGRDLAWNAPIETALTDLEAAADHLASVLGGAEHVGAVGFCYGGMLAAALASRSARHLAAAVAYYPSMAAQLLVDDRPQRPLLVHLGDTDQRVTVEDGLALEARWPDATFHHHQAGHGFNCELRPDYDADAAATAWDLTLAFLDEHLAGDHQRER